MEENKKSPLEELPREELVKKCRTQLGLLQKAKLSKEALQRENKELREKLVKAESEADTGRELVERLTQQKLELVNDGEGVRNENKALLTQLRQSDARVYELEIEIESQKRQAERLSDDNERLLQSLEGLSAEIESLKKEAEVRVEEETESVTVIKEENLKLHTLNEELDNRIKKLLSGEEILNMEKEELLVKLGEAEVELKNRQAKIEANEATMDEITTELHKNRALIDSLKKDLEKTNGKLKDNQIFSSGIASDLENNIEKLRSKLSLYNEKNQKFAHYVKCLKEERNNILKDFKCYMEQVREWHNQLESFAFDLLSRMRALEVERESLKIENERLLKRTGPELTVSGTQTDADDEANQVEEAVKTLKRENSELLSEMNEMNQALKERGETISKQQAYCDEMVKKLRDIEAQQEEKNVEKEEAVKRLLDEIERLKENKEKDDEIGQLRAEVESYREKLLNTSLPQDVEETMSTSTISRADDLCRIKDLESSWEEKYGKLRILAVKLKGKIRDLTEELGRERAEKSDLQQKLTAGAKTTQSLQSQCDRLQDDLDRCREELKRCSGQIEASTLEISSGKEKLAENDEIIGKLRSEVEGLQKEKHNVEMWKKQVSTKVQSLRKELESNAIIKGELDGEIEFLKKELRLKDEQLKGEIEKHNQAKTALQELNNERKRKSVLNLEMQDYERSVKDLAQKLEKKQELVNKLKNQIDAQKSTVATLKERNKLLEESVETETSNLNSALGEIAAHKQKIEILEQTVAAKDEKIQSLNDSLESARAINEDLSTELSKVVADHQKLNAALKGERDALRIHTLSLEQKAQALREQLKIKEEELVRVEGEFESYKVRAQSVLRQSQSRDVGLEEKLEEEVACLKIQVATLETKAEEYKSATAALSKEKERLVSENEEILRENSDLKVKLQEQSDINKQLADKNEQILAEHAETVKGLKVHADTLVQCYRQQISEQEVRHNREIIELQSKLEKAPSPYVEPPLLPTMPREEGEGSESVDSSFSPQTHPLEKLLGNDDCEHEVAYLKKQLNDNESKVAHLTAILADTEQDLAKHVQMNKLLKEEIRRQQRSVEREKHAENLEYLKNVVFKFLTLSTGDERLRLVPVLNTILKLSPEETRKLNSLAKGEAGAKGWSDYLPLGWPRATKPS